MSPYAILGIPAAGGFVLGAIFGHMLTAKAMSIANKAMEDAIYAMATVHSEYDKVLAIIKEKLPL